MDTDPRDTPDRGRQVRAQVAEFGERFGEVELCKATVSALTRAILAARLITRAEFWDAMETEVKQRAEKKGGA